MICEGVWLSVAFFLLGPENRSAVSSVIEAVAVVENESEIASLRDTHAVIRAVHRRKVAYDKKVLFVRLVAPYIAEDTPVAVIGVDPLEAVPVVVQPVQSRILAVKGQKILYILEKILMQVFISQIQSRETFSSHSCHWPKSWPMKRSFLPGWVIIKV